MHPLFAENIRTYAEGYRRWKQNAAIYLPKGRPPEVGELFVQRDIASSLSFMAAEERRARKRGGRSAGLKAARDAFYKGDIAKKIARYHKDNGGWVTADDLAAYEVSFEKLIKRQIKHGIDVVVPVGTTGESATLTHDEHRICIEIAVDACKGTNVKVLAGADRKSTRLNSSH